MASYNTEARRGSDEPMQTFRDFFDMGGYAAFVWPSFAACAVLMIALVVSSVLRQRRMRARLDEVEKLVRHAEGDEAA